MIEGSEVAFFIAQAAAIVGLFKVMFELVGLGSIGKVNRLNLVERLCSSVDSDKKMEAELTYKVLMGYDANYSEIKPMVRHCEPSRCCKCHKLVHNNVQVTEFGWEYKGMWKRKGYRNFQSIVGHSIYWPSAFLALAPFILLTQQSSNPHYYGLAIISFMIFSMPAYLSVKQLWKVRAGRYLVEEFSQQVNECDGKR